MVARQVIARKFFGRAAPLRGLAAAGAAGILLVAGCGKITSSPVAPAAVDTGVAAVRLETAAGVVAPGNEVSVVVSVTDKNGGPVKDGTLVSMVNDALGAIIPSTATTVNGKVHVKFRAGTTQGTSTIKATAGGATFVATVKIQAGAVAPPPPIDPPPTGSGKDEIPASSITWRHMNISAWPVKDTVTRVTVGGGAICIHHTGLGKWPATKDPVVGNPWVFAKIDGQWYGATWEWLRPGVACKSPDGGWVGLGLQTKTGPLNKWTPRSGEEVGFAVSSPARGTDMGLPHRRTNIVKIRWP